jgi:hypothetical protein
VEWRVFAHNSGAAFALAFSGGLARLFSAPLRFQEARSFFSSIVTRRFFTLDFALGLYRFFAATAFAS